MKLHSRHKTGCNAFRSFHCWSLPGPPKRQRCEAPLSSKNRLQRVSVVSLLVSTRSHYFPGCGAFSPETGAAVTDRSRHKRVNPTTRTQTNLARHRNLSNAKGFVQRWQPWRFFWKPRSDGRVLRAELSRFVLSPDTWSGRLWVAALSRARGAATTHSWLRRSRRSALCRQVQ